ARSQRRAGRRPAMKTPATQRSGFALIWAIVILSILTVVMALVTRMSVTAMRLADRRQQQLQADWLARSGGELAATRLLGDPKGYEGETVELIPDGKVRIAIQTKADAPGTYRVTCEARYPAEEPDAVLRKATRTFRRVTEKDRTRLEVVTPP